MWSRGSTASRPAQQAPAAQGEPGPGPPLTRTPTGTSLHATRPPRRPRWVGWGSFWSRPLVDAVEARLRQRGLWCRRAPPQPRARRQQWLLVCPWGSSLGRRLLVTLHLAPSPCQWDWECPVRQPTVPAPSCLPTPRPSLGSSLPPRPSPGAPAWPPFSPTLLPSAASARSHTCGLHPGLA